MNVIFSKLFFDSECRKYNFVKTLFIDDIKEAKVEFLCDFFVVVISRKLALTVSVYIEFGPAKLEFNVVIKCYIVWIQPSWS